MKQDVLRNPCYDPETKTDCPRRCAGCSAFCEDWDEYRKQRDAEYDRKFKEARAKSAARDGYYNGVGGRLRKHTLYGRCNKRS